MEKIIVLFRYNTLLFYTLIKFEKKLNNANFSLINIFS